MLRIDPRAEPTEEELAELERPEGDARREASDVPPPKSAAAAADAPPKSAAAGAAPRKIAAVDAAQSKSAAVDAAPPKSASVDATPPKSAAAGAVPRKAALADAAPSKTAAANVASPKSAAGAAPPKMDRDARLDPQDAPLENPLEGLADVLPRAAADRANATQEEPRDSSSRDELAQLRLALAAAEKERDALTTKLEAEREAMRIEREGFAAERLELEREREEKSPKAAVVGVTALAAPALTLASSAHVASAAGALSSGVGVGPFLDAGTIGIGGTLVETAKMAMRVIPWKLVARGASVMMIPALLYANRTDIKKTSDRMRNIPKVVISSRIAGDIATELEASSVNTPLPRRRDFVAWVRKNYKGLPGSDPARDQWGTLFRLDEAPRMLGVRSAGPDRRFDTKDDIFRGVRDMGFNRM